MRPAQGLGKLNDHSVPDGNRRSAQLGDSIIKTVILDGLYLHKMIGVGASTAPKLF